MNKENELEDQMILADILLRLKTLETVLIKKQVFTQEEYLAEMGSIAQQMAKSLLEKAQVEGDLDELISSLNNSTEN